MNNSPFSNLFGGPVKKSEADSLAEIQPETRFEPEPEPEKGEEKAVEEMPEIPEMEDFGGFANEFEEEDEDLETGDAPGFTEPPPITQKFEIEPPSLPETKYEVPEPEKQAIAKKEEPVQDISFNPYREPETVVPLENPTNSVAQAPKQEKTQVGFNDLFGNNQEEEPKKEPAVETKEEQETEVPVQETREESPKKDFPEELPVQESAWEVSGTSSAWEVSDTNSAWDTQKDERHNATEKEAETPDETPEETPEVETTPESEPTTLPETNDPPKQETDPKQVEKSTFSNPLQEEEAKQKRNYEPFPEQPPTSFEKASVEAPVEAPTEAPVETPEKREEQNKGEETQVENTEKELLPTLPVIQSPETEVSNELEKNSLPIERQEKEKVDTRTVQKSDVELCTIIATCIISNQGIFESAQNLAAKAWEILREIKKQENEPQEVEKNKEV